MTTSTKALPRWVPSFALLLLVSGLALVVFAPAAPEQLSRVSARVDTQEWSVLLGAWLIYLVASNSVLYTISRFLGSAFKLYDHDSESPENRLTPIVVGACESLLYPGALLAGKADFVAVWLAVKVAGSWVRWSGEGLKPDDAKKQREAANEARRRFNRFLVGNALSILSTVAFYAFLKAFILKS